MGSLKGAPFLHHFSDKNIFSSCFYIKENPKNNEAYQKFFTKIDPMSYKAKIFTNVILQCLVDAASQRTGIASMTNSISARQRWAKSHFLRTTIISYLNEGLNLTEKEDITEGLKASNINKNNLVVKEIKSMIENSLNPFNKDADPDCLCNICAEKSCKKGTEDFLLNVESIGNEARKHFIQECVENPNRFKERIKKIKFTVLK